MLRSMISLLVVALFHISSAQDIGNLPGCLKTCIRKYNSRCEDLDITCICKLSSDGSFLTKVAQCYQSSCGGFLNFPDLLTSLQPLCQLDGHPIPDAIMSSAEAVATESGSSPSSEISYTLIGTGLTATAALSTTTVLQTETNAEGQTQTLEIPESYDSTTTILGDPVTRSGSLAKSTTTAVSVIPLASLLSSIPSSTGSAATSTATVLPLTGSAGVSTTSTATTSATTASSTSTFINGSLFSGTPRSAGISSSLGLVLCVVLGALLL